MLISGTPAEYCPSDCGISKIYNPPLDSEQEKTPDKYSNKQGFVSDIWPEAWIWITAIRSKLERNPHIIKYIPLYGFNNLHTHDNTSSINLDISFCSLDVTTKLNH